MRRHFIAILAFLAATSALVAQTPDEPPRSSACHVFIDYQFVWTLEVIRQPSGKAVPILNIVTFPKGQWDLRPTNIHILNNRREEAEIEKFSIDTGVPDEPYDLRYLKVHGDSFIGMDLIGDFQGFETPSKVTIELGDNNFDLEPIDCLEFENLVQLIDQINYESPDIRQDYDVLKIPFKGKREARRRSY
jgi:hypothetical protein